MPAWARIALGVLPVIADLLSSAGEHDAASHIRKATDIIGDRFPREPAAREAAGEAAAAALEPPHE